MEFSHDIAQSVVGACLNQGLLINQLKPNALRFIPPLTISEAEVDKALGILDRVLATIDN
jgi:4-aminobutyrate aminotransferase-like enzyme